MVGSEYPYAVWATQGGGLAKRSGDNYIFVETPDCPGLDVGDFVPSEWGLAPANERAREEMEGSEDDVDDDDFIIAALAPIIFYS